LSSFTKRAVSRKPRDWLNKSIFVCAGARYAGSIKLWVWRVT